MEKLIKTLWVIITLIMVVYAAGMFGEPWFPELTEYTRTWSRGITYILAIEIAFAAGRAYQKHLHKKYSTLKFVHPPASISKHKK